MQKEAPIPIVDENDVNIFSIVSNAEGPVQVRSRALPFLSVTVPYIKAPRLFDIREQDIVIPFSDRTTTVVREGNIFQVGGFGNVVMDGDVVTLYTRKQVEYSAVVPHPQQRMDVVTGMVYMATALASTGG